MVGIVYIVNRLFCVTFDFAILEGEYSFRAGDNKADDGILDFKV